MRKAGKGGLHKGGCKERLDNQSKPPFDPARASEKHMCVLELLLLDLFQRLKMPGTWTIDFSHGSGRVGRGLFGIADLSAASLSFHLSRKSGACARCTEASKVGGRASRGNTRAAPATFECRGRLSPREGKEKQEKPYVGPAPIVRLLSYSRDLEVKSAKQRPAEPPSSEKIKAFFGQLSP